MANPFILVVLASQVCYNYITNLRNLNQILKDDK